MKAFEQANRIVSEQMKQLDPIFDELYRDNTPESDTMKTLTQISEENGATVIGEFDRCILPEGSIVHDNEAQLLAAFNAWSAQQMGGDISEWLKDGETVIQRLERERSDLGSTLKMLAEERRKVESLQAAPLKG